MNLRLSLSVFSAVLSVLSGIAAAAPQSAPATKPAPKTETKKPAAKKPKSPTQAAALKNLNAQKQDKRNNKDLSETLKELEEIARKNEAAGRELKRLDISKLKDLKDEKGTDATKGKLGEIKDGIAPETMEKVKSAVKDLAEEVGDDAKKAALEVKKQVAEKAIASKDTPSRAAPTAPVRRPPVTFDQVPPAGPPQTPGAEAETKGKKVISENEFIRADEIIAPGNRDPGNPDRILPDSDPRTRTYFLKGNVQVRMENYVQDSQELTVIAMPGSGGLSGMTGGEPAPVKAAPGKKGDPVQSSAKSENDGPPFERMIATGNVYAARRHADGELQIGRGGLMIYEGKTGDIIFKDWPEAQKGRNAIIARRKDAVINMYKTKAATSDGCDFRTVEEADGKPAAKPPVPATRARPPQPVSR